MIWILFIATMALSLWAAARVKAVYSRYNQLPVRSGLSGAQVAGGDPSAQRAFMMWRDCRRGRDAGRSLRSAPQAVVLSPDNFHGRTAAALGVAAHECGHAIQQALAYMPLHWRMAAVGITTFASQIVMWLPAVGFVHWDHPALTGALIMASAWASSCCSTW